MSLRGPLDTDVAILGGGLAGLCLAIQLKRQDPAIRIAVIERNVHPVREAAFKVGESTVEVGAHYFANVLGLREHLDTEQIRKFGFRFFFSEGREQVDRCTEIGVSEPLPTPSWQLDRGRFENFLGVHARELGVEFLDGATVRDVELGTGDADHRVVFKHAGESRQARARWVVDASGRAAVLKRKLGLAESNDHDVNAVWWRVDGHLKPDEWSTDPSWRQRCTLPNRWKSTNHMCGPGYWLWLIPLASGAHSIGIVCDAGMHPLDGIDTHDKAMDWVRRHQPRIASDLDDPRHEVQDFRFLRHFSHGCREVFSGDRWALTGDAGVFLDPFYSPGSDFIAISNGYICDLISKDRAGTDITPYADIYQQLYFSFYRSTLTLYQGQYPLFGDAAVMPLKVIWDYTYYWSLLAPLYISGRTTSLTVLGRMRETFTRAGELNEAMQAMLAEWGRLNTRVSGEVPAPLDERELDQYGIEWFRDINEALSDELDDDAFVARMQGNVVLMDRLAAELLAGAREQYPGLDDHGLGALVEDVPAYADGLLPPQWYGAAAVPA